MALLHVRFFSEIMEMQMSMSVCYPQARKHKSFDEPPAVLYLLHGLSDDHSIWMANVPIERYIEGKNIAVVMPDGHRGFYTNHTYRYFDYLSEELPRIVEQFFNVDSSKAYTAGFSMGGYGALKLGLTFPERFRHIGAFAPAVLTPEVIKASLARFGEDSLLIRELRGMFGERQSGENDIAYLAAHQTAALKPKIFLSCGTKDDLLSGAHTARKVLSENGFDVNYRELDGAGHTWDYVDAEFKEFLKSLEV